MNRSRFRLALCSIAWAVSLSVATDASQRSVRGKMQPRPGAAEEEVEVAVHEVPVDPPSLSVAEAMRELVSPLTHDELVLGVVVNGHPMAYPIRYLATTEVIDDTVGDTPAAPTW